MKSTEIPGSAGHPEIPAGRFNTLKEWLDWQETLHFTSIELGLDRCREVAGRMHLLPMPCFVISVAGTNGKGSTAVMLHNILCAAGYRVGLYTSPHLLRYNERIRIDGTVIDDATLCQTFDRIDKARGATSLTYFEFGTLAALDIFRNRKVDIAVLEVGMGGRLDAVNMVDADIAILCTVDIDHEQWLGYDRESIGKEKAGIFRPQRPAVCADPDPPQSVVKAADDMGARLLRAGIDYTFDKGQDGWSWQSGPVSLPQLPYPGDQHYQAANAAGVLMVLQSMADRFPVPEKVLASALADFKLPGRFQPIQAEVSTIIDVAHNRQSAAMLAANIRALPKTGRIHLVLGMLKDKNHAAFLKELSDCVDEWYLCTLDNTRGSSAAELAVYAGPWVGKSTVGMYDNVPAAIEAARSVAAAGDRIIITGSFVTAAIAMHYLGVKI